MLQKNIDLLNTGITKKQSYKRDSFINQQKNDPNLK